MLSDSQREALLLEVHREIEAAAARAAEAIAGLRRSPTVDYPPNGGLSPAEEGALPAGVSGPEGQSAVRKLVADAAAAPLFKLFCLLDGVADPEGFAGNWPPVQLLSGDAPAGPAGLMLHDAFLETYWTWREKSQA